MRNEIQPGHLEALRQVLKELSGILGSSEDAVLVGGTVPYLLIPQDKEPHEGTIDVDLVLNLEPASLDPVYTLHEKLERQLFIQDPKRPFRYEKAVDVEGLIYPVLVELLGGGIPPPSGLRFIASEDVHVTIIPGMEAALECPILVEIPGDSNVNLHTASMPAFLAMKALALQHRETVKKGKDAYDILYCLRNYPGGVDALAKEFRRLLSIDAIRSGLALLREQFSSVDSLGPTAYGAGAEEEALLRREAFERVSTLLEKVGH